MRPRYVSAKRYESLIRYEPFDGTLTRGGLALPTHVRIRPPSRRKKRLLARRQLTCLHAHRHSWGGRDWETGEYDGGLICVDCGLDLV